MPKHVVKGKITFFQRFHVVPIIELLNRFLIDLNVDINQLNQSSKHLDFIETLPRSSVSSLKFDEGDDDLLKALRLTILKPVSVSYAKWCTRCHKVYKKPNCRCGIGIRCACGGRTRYGLCQKCRTFTYRIAIQIVAEGCDQTGTILLKFNGKVANNLLEYFDGISLVKTMATIQRETNLSPSKVAQITANSKLSHLRGKEIVVAGKLFRFKFNPQNPRAKGFPCLQVLYSRHLDEMNINKELDFIFLKALDRKIPKNLLHFAKQLHLDNSLVDRLYAKNQPQDQSLSPDSTSESLPTIYDNLPFPSKHLLLCDLFDGQLKRAKFFGKNYTALFIPKLECRIVRATIIGTVTKKPRVTSTQIRFQVSDRSTDTPLQIILRGNPNTGMLHELTRRLRTQQLVQIIGRPVFKDSKLVLEAEGVYQVTPNFVVIHFASCMSIPSLFKYQAEPMNEIAEQESQEVVLTP